MKKSELRKCTVKNLEGEYYFHEWALDCVETNDGIVTWTMAIVESEDGQIIQVDKPKDIKFINQVD